MHDNAQLQLVLNHRSDSVMSGLYAETTKAFCIIAMINVMAHYVHYENSYSKLTQQRLTFDESKDRYPLTAVETFGYAILLGSLTLT